MRIGFQLCPYDCKKEQLVDAVKIVRKMFMRRPNYLRMRGEPALFIFWTGVQDGNKTLLKAIEESTLDCVRIASTLRMYNAKDERAKTFDTFDGWSLYSPLELCQSSKWEPLWRQAYRNSDAGVRNLRLITVSPGYDDRHLRDVNRKGNLHRHVDRQQGATYRRSLDFALSVEERPDMVIVTSFNEYHENTQIEPSRNHGSLYMDMTRNFIQQARKQWQ